MTKVKVSDLDGIALDYMVDKIECDCWISPNSFIAYHEDQSIYNYSINRDIGGAIIERELIATEPHWNNAGYHSPNGYWDWLAHVLGKNNIDGPYTMQGSTPLIAGMRCYVSSKLGDTVDVPASIMKAWRG